MKLGLCIAAAVGQASSCSPHLNKGLGTSYTVGVAQKKTKKKKSGRTTLEWQLLFFHLKGEQTELLKWN